MNKFQISNFKFQIVLLLAILFTSCNPDAKWETKDVEIVIPADDLKLWDLDKHDWAFSGKKVKLQVGASSQDIRLKKNVKL